MSDRNPGEADAVVLSTDGVASQMKERCRQVYGDRMETVNLYEGLPPGPYPLV